MTFRIDPIILKQQIANLFVQFPELAADEELRLDTLEGETELLTLLDRLVTRIRDAKIMQAGIDKIIEDLTGRRKRFEWHEEVSRRLALDLMNCADVRKVQLPEATLSIRASQAGVRIIDPAFIPDKYWRIKREPDLRAIKDDLKNNVAVAGAALSNQPDHLAIHTK